MRALGVLFIASAVMVVRWVGRGHGWWGPEGHGATTPNQAPTGAVSGIGTLPPGTPPNLLPGSPGSPLPMPPPSSGSANSQWGAVFPA